MPPRRKPRARRVVVRAPRPVITAPAPNRMITLGGVNYGVAPGGQLLGPTSTPTDTSSGGQTTAQSAVGLSGTASTTIEHGGPFGFLADFVSKLPAYFKIGAGGLGLMVSGLALVYVAGRNTAPVAAAKTAATVVTPVGKAAGAVSAATEGGEARKIARSTRATEKTERARSRVVTDAGTGKTSVSSKRSGADTRAAADEYRATKGSRDRERLSALRGEKRRRKEAPALNSKTRKTV